MNFVHVFIIEIFLKYESFETQQNNDRTLSVAFGLMSNQ